MAFGRHWLEAAYPLLTLLGEFEVSQVGSEAVSLLPCQMVEDLPCSTVQMSVLGHVRVFSLQAEDQVPTVLLLMGLS